MIKKKPVSATWTEEQWQAIYQDGSSIIVSAGAGSGKTAVLTERIIEKLKQGVSISSLVVLTFTKAAAFEMKTRVRNKIKREIKEGNNSLEKELERLDTASITTFDSYSLSLVKKYHYLLGIGKDIAIADNIVLERKKQTLMTEAFQQFYEKQDPLFLNLLDTFTIKDDDKMKTICLKLNASLESLAHKTEYLKEYENKFFNDSLIEQRILEYETLLGQKKELIAQLFQSLKEHAVHEKSLEFIEKLSLMLEPLFLSKDYNDYQEFITTYSTVLLPRSKKIEELELENLKYNYEELKKELKKLMELCSYENRNSLKKSILKTKDTVSALIAILREYDSLLWQYKKEENIYEFSDIARLAISLLETHPEIGAQMKREINEIMIDEYQDTNDIGDYFISLISNHNVYMVGDIKQSIYRFRNANPSIFMDKYNRYSNHQDGEKIDLNQNFRSRKEVLEDINFIFEKIMDEEIGGANYKEGHAMIFGNKSYEEEGKTNNNHHFEILNYEYQKTEFSKTYRTEEIEAFLIAKDIKEKIENHYQVFDKDQKQRREMVYRDVAILLDRKTSFDLYKKIFTYLEIPLTIHKEEAFVYSDEIFIIQNMMKWILSLKDPEYAKDHLKYAVTSIARSVLGQVTDESLFVFLMEQGESFSKSLSNIDSPVASIHQKMKQLAEESKYLTLSELLSKMYQTFDLYHEILKLENIETVTLKLDYLLDVACNLEKMGYQLKEFIDYLEEAINGKTDVTFQRNQETDANSVNLMTIHKSKGLEYHICYYAGLQKQFSKADLKEKFLFHSKLGFIVPYFEEGIRETFYKHLLKEEYQKEDVSERLRVFYVALSRAKEKMIFVTNLLDQESKKASSDFVELNTRLQYRSFYDILESISSHLKPYVKTIDLTQISLSKDYEQTKSSSFETTLQKSDDQPNYIEIQVEKEEKVQKRFSKETTLLEEEQQKKVAFGTKLHECLEYLDYKDLSSLEKMSLSSFEKQKLTAFLKQDFWKLLEQPKFYKELEFIEENGLEEVHGKIDLLIEDKTCAYIIDYKLKNIDDLAYEEQIRGYAKVVEKRMKKPVRMFLYSLLEERYREVEAEKVVF